MLAHLAVSHRNACLRNQLFQPRIHDLDALNAVVQHIHLSAARKLAQNRVAHQSVRVFHDVGLHRIAFLRRRLQQAHIANADHRHVQRARNRRGRERQHVQRLLHLLDGFLVIHAEALLLVHHQQAEVFELYILRQQSMRADDHVDFSGFELFQDLLLLGGFEPADHLDAHRKMAEARLHGIKMLLNENRGRREHCRLLSAHDGLEDRAQRHFGLAIAHIAAEQTIHRAIRFHIALDILDCSHLIGRFLIGKTVLEFALPGRIRLERMAGQRLALRIEL